MRLPGRALMIVAAVAIGTVARGDVFRIFDDPRDAAQARVDIIQQATNEISAL